MSSPTLPTTAERGRIDGQDSHTPELGNLPLMRLQGLLQSCKGLDIEQSRSRMRQLEPIFAVVLPVGTAVVVDLQSCTFVHASVRIAALKLFIEQYGRDAKGWSFEVGLPMSIGAGSCPR